MQTYEESASIQYHVWCHHLLQIPLQRIADFRKLAVNMVSRLPF